MARSLLLLLAAATLFAADDPWTKVKELKSGTELQIYREGAAKPLEAKFDEARDDALVVVVKNEQRAIPRTEIDRIDYRPKGGGMTKETKVTQTGPDSTPPVGMNHGPNTAGQSYSSGVSFSKPGFETVYRRPPTLGVPVRPSPAPKK